MGIIQGIELRSSLLLVMATAMASGQAAAQDEPPLTEEAYWGEVPVVMSATRMSQPLGDAPVAVTVIDRRMIEASGAREIPELFRLVPGFIVGYHDGHTASVSYHRSEDRYARQMQVLIDGRSVYTTAMGGVAWDSLPITLDDIERIEVVRGPNSASYGANSFLGVINIITRHAVLDQGTSVKTNIGDGGVRELFLRHGGGAGKLDYRVSAAVVEDEGLPTRYDDKLTRIFSLRTDYTINTTDMFTFEAGVAGGPRDVENRNSPELPWHEKEDLTHHIHFEWERNLGLGEGVSVQLYHIFQRTFEDFRTDYITVDQPPLTLVVDPMDVSFSRSTNRTDLELQHNFIISDNTRVAWGGGLRDDKVWGSLNLMGDETIHNYLKFAFMNMEWDPDNPFLVNAGAMVENYSTTGTSVSPRAGVNYHFSPNHSMRLTASKAVRTPSIFEYAADYHYEGTGNVYSGSTLVIPNYPVYQEYWIGTRKTDVENITSYELGYHGTPVQGALELDIKVYRDKLKDLLTLEKNTSATDLDGINWYYVNGGAYLIKGAEAEVKFSFDDSSLYCGYAYTEIYDEVLQKELLQAPQNSFSLLYMVDMDQATSVGVGYYYMDYMQGWETTIPEFTRDPVRRLDMKVARKFDLDGYAAELALSARNILGKYEEMELLRPKSSYPSLNEVDSSAYVTLKVQMN
jgi:iron complex outermembrane receptor protein